eukprot:884718-Alexandrium_andersonii.AAC.1
MSASLVGSEMCIRDRAGDDLGGGTRLFLAGALKGRGGSFWGGSGIRRARVYFARSKSRVTHW